MQPQEQSPQPTQEELTEAAYMAFRYLLAHLREEEFGGSLPSHLWDVSAFFHDIATEALDNQPLQQQLANSVNALLKLGTMTIEDGQIKTTLQPPENDSLDNETNLE